MRVHSIVSFVTGLVLFLGFASGHSIRSHELDQASRFEYVTAIRTPSQKATSQPEFDLAFGICGQDQRLRLRLESNHHLLAQNPQLQYLDSNGKVRRTESFPETGNRVFKGSVWAQSAGQTWERAGWARIYIVRDGYDPLFEGSFSAFGEQYDVGIVKHLVDVTDTPTQDDRMVVHRRSGSNVRRNTADSSHCAIDKVDTNHLAPRTEDAHDLSPLDIFSPLDRRQSTFDPGDLLSNIGSLSGCPSGRRVALIGIATDCSYTSAFDSAENLRRSIISMVNTASEVFEGTFNISLGLQNLTISDANCPGTASDSSPWNVGCSEGDMNWRLQQFTSWRSSLSDSTNAYWTLMTGCPSGSEVGISWIGQLCNSRSSTNVVARTTNQWQVFAHESAHTFGAVHDCDSSGCGSSTQCCPLSSSTCDADAQYLMNPFSISSQTEFSRCTVGNVCSLLGSENVRASCLLSDTNIPTLTTGECGNGIVEAGEECDCGDNCDGNSCCDGSTCRLRDGAVCDDTAGPCCTNCQFAVSNTVCRESRGSCDIQETCSGNSSACPADRHIADGQTCGNTSGLFCANGECTNRDMQCRQLLGSNSTGVSSCNNDSCTLSCSVNWYGSDNCMSMRRQVQDGTPCSSGLCRGGRCRRESEDSSSSWVDRHLPLVIGLSAGIGGALLLAVLLGFIICCCCRRRPPVKKDVPPASTPAAIQVPRQAPNPAPEPAPGTGPLPYYA